MDTLLKTYRIFFGGNDKLYKIFSPYRVCPVGAHVDHQYGLVTGFALDMGIDILFSATENGNVEMCSLAFEGLTVFNVTKPVEPRHSDWGDYLRGAVWAMQKDFHLAKGIRGVVNGSMPIGGVSSSAALLCGIVMAVAKVNDIELDKTKVVYYASEAERKYVGLQNGILDQACVMLCEENKLLYLDTKTSGYSLLDFGSCGGRDIDIEIGVFFSGVTRKLTGTDYNLRVSECKTAAWIMQAYEDQPLKELADTRLRDVSEKLFCKYQDKMPVRFAKRARHFYSECERVEKAVEAWKKGDIKRFGQYVSESCKSSIENYECGSPELTDLYDIMCDTDGIYGGRFSGAGFKGACIAIIDPSKKELISDRVSSRYLSRYPQYKNRFKMFFCKISNGASFQ